MTNIIEVYDNGEFIGYITSSIRSKAYVGNFRTMLAKDADKYAAKERALRMAGRYNEHNRASARRAVVVTLESALEKEAVFARMSQGEG